MALQPLINELKNEFHTLRMQYFEHEIERKKLEERCRKQKNQLDKLQQKTSDQLESNAMALNEILQGRKNIITSPQFCKTAQLIQEELQQKQLISHQLFVLKFFVIICFIVQISVYAFI